MTNKSSSKQKSIVIQAPASVKPDGSTDDGAAEKTFTVESPAKHRKIIRSFQQSKSTKVLVPNSVYLEKPIMPMMNNMTILTEVSEQKKNRDMATQD